jgi:hypothetical protein
MLVMAMTKDNEQYAYLTFTGDFDPDTITARLQLQPTECWRKGDRNERTHYERKFSRWSLNSRLDRSVSLEDHVQDVLIQALERAEAIRQVGEEYIAYVQLVGWFHNDYPGFGLKKETISGLAQLNVGIDCDFYYLYSHEREDS